MVDESNWPATVALPGVVSEGTLRSEDLIPAFLDVLKQIDRDAWAEAVVHIPQWRDLGPDNYNQALSEYSMELQEKLDELAPEGYYFGCAVGDGACLGFFEHVSTD